MARGLLNVEKLSISRFIVRNKSTGLAGASPPSPPIYTHVSVHGIAKGSK